MNAMYRVLPQFTTQTSNIPISAETATQSVTTIPSEFPVKQFLQEYRWSRKDCYRLLWRHTEKTYIQRGRTGHTEAVKIIYDKTKISYRSLCDIFWGTRDPTNRNYLNFGLSTHRKSAIYYIKEEERKQPQESKIRRQMKLNKRIVTKIIKFDSYFYVVENQHQKYYLQKYCWLCESLSLRSTVQFVESNIACKLIG
ncbi:hypothetical protein Pint_18735 [Pistacia integerrima]|uniref:Uncharacterized protein n=1 Tax=Pistacia integerrima TaxID=434235 RepID=A0ACC0Z067_9ROSI|nr:hypothetical protein Pint_18735 [Pistacia integerrima]